MINKEKESPNLNIPLWIAQALLAIFLLMGTFLKFQPIEQIAVMMPWTGEIPENMVRMIGLIDLLGAVGLILPGLLNIKPQLTYWAALGVCTLMLSAIVFHVARGEAAVISANIVALGFAVFIAWGRKSKYV
jgi:uncharacterized membrane protein